MSETRQRRKKKTLAFRKKKGNKMSIIIAVAVVLVFCGYMSVRGYALMQEREALREEVVRLEESIRQEELREEELKEFETYTHTKKYAEEVAKEVLGYVYEGEIIFKPE